MTRTSISACSNFALAALLVAFSSPFTAAAADCDHLLKTSVSDPHQISGIKGSAQLCIDTDGNHASVSEWAGNLIPDHAYTTWFAYIDDPAQCGNYPGGTPGVCSDPDGFMPADNPAVVFGRMDGAVAGRDGRLHMTGEYRDLRFSHGSMVWIIMFEHGSISTTDNRYRSRQLLTPQLPILGPPGLGAPVDGNVGHGVALAVFNIP